ncbi:MAG: hypothetical protein Q7T86_18400 [Hyphomicrobiaceae bacterium]|nr:hypothetical protein [Hyphomicrobiaceae bacterium]
MLRALRANKGWPRAIALVLLLAFSAGLLHVHASGASAAPVAIADVHDGHGHDHDGAPGPSVTPHCAFCAVVTGKFYVPAEMLAFIDAVGAPITFGAIEARLTSTPPTDLFRPPIPFIG